MRCQCNNTLPQTSSEALVESASQRLGSVFAQRLSDCYQSGLDISSIASLIDMDLRGTEIAENNQSESKET